MSRNEKDIAIRALLRKPDVVEDLLNILVFKETVGNLNVDPRPVDQAYQQDENIREVKRDAFALAKSGTISFLLVGFEHQTQEDWTMVIRTLLHDAISYHEQLENHGKREILPVVTYVLYAGLNPKFNGILHLKDLFKADMSEQILNDINDWTVRVFNIPCMTMEEVSRFQSDMRLVADYFVQMKTTGRYVVPAHLTIQHPSDTLKVMTAISDDKVYGQLADRMEELKKEKGEVTMESVFEEYARKAVAENTRKVAQSVKQNLIRQQQKAANWLLSQGRADEAINLYDEEKLNAILDEMKLS